MDYSELVVNQVLVVFQEQVELQVYQVHQVFQVQVVPQDKAEFQDYQVLQV